MARLISRFGLRKRREYTDDIPVNERREAALGGYPEAQDPAAVGGAFAGSPEEAAPKPAYVPRSGAADSQTDSVTEESTAPQSGSADAAPQEASAQSGTEYDLDAGLSELYTNLYNKLRSYGVTSIPSFDALFGLFESFLRPSIDAAIAARMKRGRTNMAELDADAYARGMGGSSYISSMRSREQDDVDSDILGLEGQYAASMSEYLYKALNAMQELEADFRKTQMNIAAQRELTRMQINAANARASAHGSGKGSGKSSGKSTAAYGHTKNGAYFDGTWYDGDFSYLQSNATYNDYAGYLRSLTPAQRYLFFTSDQRTWRMRRWQVQYNLPQIDYLDLYSEYMTSGSVPSIPKPPKGVRPKWPNMLY